MSKQTNLCPICGENIIIKDESRGQVICNTCGTVLQQNCIDTGPERCSFTEEEYKKLTRVGPRIDLTFFDKGLTTNIGKEDRDAFGVKLSPEKRAEIHRLRKWQERTKSAKTLDRNLRNAMIELNSINSQLKLTEGVKKSVAYYYRKIARKGLTRGRSIRDIIFATIYIVLKENEKIIEFKRIKELSKVSIKLILRYCNLIQKELELTLPPTKPQKLIPLFCSELSLSTKTESLAIKLLDNLQKKINLSGKSHSGLVSAAIYFACLINKESRSQKKIATVIGTTEVTLRKHFRTLKNYFPKILESETLSSI